MKHQRILKLIGKEYIRARRIYPPFHSTHEGFAVMKEEVDELWELVKKNKGYMIDDRTMVKECIQIAAMSLAFIVDLGGVNNELR